MSSSLKEDIYNHLKKIEGTCYQDDSGNKYILEIDHEQEGISKEGICFFAKYDDGTKELLTTYHPTVSNRNNLEHRSSQKPVIHLAPTPYYKEQDRRTFFETVRGKKSKRR